MNDDAPTPETTPQAAAPVDIPEPDVSTAVEAAIAELVAAAGRSGQNKICQ